MKKNEIQSAKTPFEYKNTPCCMTSRGGNEQCCLVKGNSKPAMTFPINQHYFFVLKGKKKTSEVNNKSL